MLESLLGHKKEEKEYICALVVSGEAIDAAIWETTHDGGAHVLKTASAPYADAWEKAIDAADIAISEVEAVLPEGTELKKVVFGLFPQWLEDDHIKETQLKNLKQLTSALSLTPIGFVELPTAISHLLLKDEGTQQTVILVGIEKTNVTVSLFKIGKLAGTKTLPRTSMLSQDVEQALTSFTDVEVLPSRMLLYGTVDNLEEIKNEMLSYPWQQKANFLHFPKVESLIRDYTVKAVAAASATELTEHLSQIPEPNPEETATAGVVTTPSPAVVPPEDTSAEVSEIAEDLGFVQGQDIAELENVTPANLPEPIRSPLKEHAPVEDVAQTSVARRGSSIHIPKLPLTLPKWQWTLKVPTASRFTLVIALVICLVLGAGAYSYAFWALPKVTVKLLVQPQLFDKTEEITIDTTAANMDASNKVLAGTTQKIEVEGSETVPATGKKTVGEKAHGEVMIFNKTLNVKTFKKGTQLSAGKLKFTLDGDVTIASASEGIGSLTYGTSKIALIAADIGTASNLAASTDFSFAELPSTSYTARNDQALSGGTSREITVVTRDDQKLAHTQAIEKLSKDAESKLTAQVGKNEKVLENSSNTKVIKEVYSKEIGDEAKDVSVVMTLTLETATYDEAKFYELIDQVVSGQISSDYQYHKENTTVSVTKVDSKADGKWVFSPHIQLKLLPKIETTNYSQDLAGKPLAQATEYLKTKAHVAGVEYDIQAPFSFLKQKLPVNPKNISIQLVSL